MSCNSAPKWQTSSAIWRTPFPSKRPCRRKSRRSMLGLPTPSCVSRSGATSPNESSRQLAARGSQTQFFPVLHRLVNRPQSTLCRLHPIPRQASLTSVAFLSSRSPPNLCSRQMGYAPCQILASLAAPATVNVLLILSLLMSLKQTANNSRHLEKRPRHRAAS